MMWLAVFFIFHESVNYGMCSTASWSAKYAGKSWLGFKLSSPMVKQWKA